MKVTKEVLPTEVGPSKRIGVLLSKNKVFNKSWQITVMFYVITNFWL